MASDMTLIKSLKKREHKLDILYLLLWKREVSDPMKIRLGSDFCLCQTKPDLWQFVSEYRHGSIILTSTSGGDLSLTSAAAAVWWRQSGQKASEHPAEKQK